LSRAAAACAATAIVGALSGPPVASQGIRLGTDNTARNYGRVTWKADIEQELHNAGTAYFVVSSGYKAGDFNIGCLIGTDPRSLRSSERCIVIAKASSPTMWA
jgi:hypothetical protein